MEQLRKPFQGVRNIVRFNWHLYAMSAAVLALLALLSGFAGKTMQPYLNFLFVLIAASIIVSLLASCYIYDLSDLYKLTWLNFANVKDGSQIVNINAGFDETSILLSKKYDKAQVTALDFYDPAKHTELSIKRARNAYPFFPGTLTISTDQFQLTNNFADLIFVILSAHEIRDSEERISFFKEIGRLVKPDGQIIVTEHLRDAPNFFVYNIGSLHFHSKKTWLTAFQLSGLKIKKEIKITPFITTFVLEKHGASS